MAGIGVGALFIHSEMRKGGGAPPPHNAEDVIKHHITIEKRLIRKAIGPWNVAVLYSPSH